MARITLDEAATLANVPKRALNRWANDNALPGAYHKGHRSPWTVDRDEFERAMPELRQRYEQHGHSRSYPAQRVLPLQPFNIVVGGSLTSQQFSGEIAKEIQRYADEHQARCGGDEPRSLTVDVGPVTTVRADPPALPREADSLFERVHPDVASYLFVLMAGTALGWFISALCRAWR